MVNLEARVKSVLNTIGSKLILTAKDVVYLEDGKALVDFEELRGVFVEISRKGVVVKIGNQSKPVKTIRDIVDELLLAGKSQGVDIGSLPYLPESEDAKERFTKMKEAISAEFVFMNLTVERNMLKIIVDNKSDYGYYFVEFCKDCIKVHSADIAEELAKFDKDTEVSDMINYLKEVDSSTKEIMEHFKELILLLRRNLHNRI